MRWPLATDVPQSLTNAMFPPSTRQEPSTLDLPKGFTRVSGDEPSCHAETLTGGQKYGERQELLVSSRSTSGG